MESKKTWKVEFQKEMTHALSARAKGNEGMARVCSRRAVGIVIGEYLTRRGYKNLTTSAYDRLSLLNSLPDVDEQVKWITNHFLLKVSHDRKLPPDVDLIREAQWLEKNLLLENTD